MAIVEHDDPIGNIKHDVHVMLNDDDGDRARYRADQLVHVRSLFRAHAGRWLIEQQHLRPARERQPDLELALATVTELANRGAQNVRQTDSGRNLFSFRTRRRGVPHGPPEHARRAGTERAGQHEIVADREIRKQIVALKRTSDANLGTAGDVEARHVAAGKQDGAGIGPQIARQQIEICGLAGAVRPDDRVTQTSFKGEATSWAAASEPTTC